MKIVTKSILSQRFGFFKKSFALPDRPDIGEICPQKIPCDLDFNKITWDFEFDNKLAIFDFNGLIWLFLNSFSALTAAVRGGSESVKSQGKIMPPLSGSKLVWMRFYHNGASMELAKTQWRLILCS